MNFWKQTNHIMAYFKEENFRGDKRLPSSFMTGFLEVSAESSEPLVGIMANRIRRVATRFEQQGACVNILLKGIPKNASISIMLPVNATTFKSP